MGDHDDQAVTGHLPQQVHHLYRGLTVQRAGGLVSQENVRVVDEGTGNGHSLHLATGELVGPLVHVVGESHLLQGLLGPAVPLGLGHPGQGEGQLHVGQDGLVRDQVIALEDKAHGVVAVGIPIAVRVLTGGAAIDDEVAAGVPVQPADDVQRGGLAAAGGAEDGDEFIVPKLQTHPPQGVHRQVAYGVGFADVG